jgi:hypothetical protein
MKTEVIMQRELFGMTISQKSKSEFFSATDLVKAGDKWRRSNNMSDFNLSAYLSSKSTKEFIDSLREKLKEEPIIKGRGKGTHTWVHPFLFIDIALAISPKLKIETYSWIFDKLIQYRNDSGDSYKKMCGALYQRANNKAMFPTNMPKIADFIRIECGVNNWENATEKQLKLRDRIHENVALLCDVLTDANEALRIGILKAKEAHNGRA